MTEIDNYVKRGFLANMLKYTEFGNREPVFPILRTSLSGLRPNKLPRQAWRPMSSAAPPSLPATAQIRKNRLPSLFLELRRTSQPGSCRLKEKFKLVSHGYKVTIEKDSETDKAKNVTW